MGIVVGIEAVLPSSVLTGLDHPDPPAVAWFMDDIAMPAAPLTYGDVAGSADWLWALGSITQSDMRERLDADIAIMSKKMTDAERARPVLNSWLRNSDNATNQVMLEGLKAAHDSLGAFFDVNVKPADAAIDHVLLHVQATADAVTAERRELLVAAEKAFLDYRATMDEGANVSEDPVASELRLASSKANTAWLNATGIALIYRAKHRRYAWVPDALNTDYAFPQFERPIVIYEDRLRFVTESASVETGPGDSNGAIGALRAVKRAVTGARRAPVRHFVHFRCGLSFVSDQSGTTATPVCEMAAPLAINYDLTGQGCEAGDFARGEITDLIKAGTHIAGDLCKESWIFPHLNVVFTPDSFTVHPPVPTGIAPNTGVRAPLSLWSLTWNGQAHVLDQPRRFPWDGGLKALPELTLTHGVRPGVATPRIWRDFDAARPGTDIPAAISADAGPAHRFIGTSYERQVSLARFTEPMRLMKLGTEPTPLRDADASFVKRLRQLQAMVKRVALETRQSAAENGETYAGGEFCELGRSQSILDTNTRDPFYEELQALARSMSSPTCETYYAYNRILEHVLHTRSDGSWLWLLERN